MLKVLTSETGLVLDNKTETTGKQNIFVHKL